MLCVVEKSTNRSNQVGIADYLDIDYRLRVFEHLKNNQVINV